MRIVSGERRGPADVTKVTRGCFWEKWSLNSADTCSASLDSHDNFGFCLQTLHVFDISMLCHPMATLTPVFLSRITVYPRSFVPFLHSFLRDATY